MQLGLANYMISTALFAGLGSRTGGRIFTVAAPLFVLSPLRQNCLATAQALEASEQGIAQGELRGMITNLGSVVSILSGFCWSRVFAFSVRANITGLIWYMATALALIQLVLARYGLPANISNDSARLR